MKKLLLATLLASASITSNAADLKPYVEASIGRMGFDDWTGADHPPLTPQNWKTGVESDVTYGLEAGLKDVLIPGIRISVSDEYIHTKIEADGAKAAAHIFTANAYYEFKNITEWTPYVGVGLGGYKFNVFNDTEFAASLKAGVNYSINQNTYAGIRATYYYLDSATGSNATIDKIDAYSVKAVVGLEF